MEGVWGKEEGVWGCEDLNKSGVGGSEQEKNKRRDVYSERSSTWSVEQQVETRLKALNQFDYHFVFLFLLCIVHFL